MCLSYLLPSPRHTASLLVWAETESLCESGSIAFRRRPSSPVSVATYSTRRGLAAYPLSPPSICVDRTPTLSYGTTARLASSHRVDWLGTIVPRRLSASARIDRSRSGPRKSSTTHTAFGLTSRASFPPASFVRVNSAMGLRSAASTRDRMWAMRPSGARRPAEAAAGESGAAADGPAPPPPGARLLLRAPFFLADFFFPAAFFEPKPAKADGGVAEGGRRDTPKQREGASASVFRRIANIPKHATKDLVERIYLWLSS
mmetsp:Transcript_28030/g.82423  ORF Transcript_28030/g.82423 Transcript_28030/m.82423 type:complete len:259 (+) Transcript_28030:1556-2332(+)